jgi:HlyD family secretion protein
MSARNRVFMILGLLTVGSLIWYLVTARTSGDLKLMGTVDANEVMVSSKIPGRIQELAIQEGQQVQAGELIATIESNDLAAAANAAKATVLSSESKLKQAMVTENQNLGETSSATINAQAQVKAATAALAQTQANLTHQQADSTRTIALAQRGIASKQASEEAVASLQASHAAVTNAQANLAAAEASLKQAQAHELLANATAHTVSANRADVENAQAMATEAGVELGYAKVFAPVSGHVNVLAAREGEVVTAGEAIATVMDLTQTWVYAPLPETQADAVQLGDSLRVVMPSGRAVDGKVIAKTALADFATQRDINGGRKRDIRTIQLKLLIPNPKEEFVPGMTAEVYVPKAKLVKQ